MSEVEVVVEEGPETPMNRDEEALAEVIYAAMMAHSRYDERGQQSANFQVGVSDLGFCSERTRRMLDHQEPEEENLLPAFIGTALGAEMEAAALELWPDAITQGEVTVTLVGDQRVYHVAGHPDLIRRSGLLVDFKTRLGLAIPRRTGPSQQQQFQRHCYAKGADEAGLFDVPLEQVMVANVWMDRAGQDRSLHVQMEPYNPEVVQAATWWLDECVYSYLNEQEARKEPAYEVCQNWCGFFRDCRLPEGMVSGLLTDDGTLAAVSLYTEGHEMEKAGKKLKDQAKAALTGIQGSTGEFAVRWVTVDGSHVNYDRKPYDRLSIQKIK